MQNINIFKAWLVTLVLFISIISTYAQTEMVDVLYLKNGSIIKGTITEMIPNEIIKIKTADGSLFVFKMAEVEKVVKEEKISLNPVVTEPKTEPSKKTVTHENPIEANIKLETKMPSPFPKIERPPPYDAGTIKISSTSYGRIYLDNEFIKNIGVYISVKIKGIKPGSHTISVKTEVDSIGKEIKVEKEQVYTYRIDDNSIGFIGKASKAPQRKRALTIRTGYLAKTKGFYNSTQIELFNMNLIQDMKFSYLSSINTINGYQFSPSFCLGLGLGIDFTNVYLLYHDPIMGGYTDHDETSLTFLPLYINLQLSLSKTKVSPYVFGNFGYNVLLSNKSVSKSQNSVISDFKTGLYLSSGVGLRFFIHKNYAFTTSVKLTYRPIKYISHVDYIEPTTQNMVSSAKEVKFNSLLLGFVLGFTL